ncbi:hypothetical protein PUNSTDRAFT_48931 [Punctularia strigosozonata HHB-11173 SS5]|uniref:uncharacterized protein n=1 Tax=Punctularia strigosozonata (strain HHB-11173) TaxID=741275 RepID=UPI0004417A2E|nr:uncharacterized protein PUNSTDRAFT_48931 [Punctularia strigosozonata HHB-11173 SS5]EIN14084.1 hypothetical protein PUNSTDRAFT_48931 [Punctularia strigosozonata HHB-11173 SS5]
MTDSETLRSMLGRDPSTPELAAHIAALSLDAPDSASPDVKVYSDAVYFNYHKLGISFVYKPISGYEPRTGSSRDQLNEGKLLLDSIDLYNATELLAGKSKSTGVQAYATYRGLPLTLSLFAKTTDGKERPTSLEVKSTTTGKDFVECLGEPDRKGGGTGPSTGSIDIWCEWSKDGLMVEFGGDKARGPQAWERGKEALWKVVSIFHAAKD